MIQRYTQGPIKTTRSCNSAIRCMAPTIDYVGLIKRAKPNDSILSISLAISRTGGMDVTTATRSKRRHTTGNKIDILAATEKPSYMA
jgi:hypothetical protein